MALFSVFVSLETEPGAGYDYNISDNEENVESVALIIALSHSLHSSRSQLYSRVQCHKLRSVNHLWIMLLDGASVSPGLLCSEWRLAGVWSSNYPGDRQHSSIKQTKDFLKIQMRNNE